MSRIGEGVGQLICRNLKEIERMAKGSGLRNQFNQIIANGVSIDSRTIKSGNLYIPLIRIKDGHHYVDEAVSKGAAASLWQNDHPDPPANIPLIYVDDCLEALQSLASSYRKELSVKVVGITGSNGKTTTKDMIDSILRTTFKVHKTEGNLNSQVGVPLTLLDMAPDTDIAVIEMGMSELGQIERLSRIARPDIAVITMIGVSHLSTLGSREQIAEAKLEIIKGLSNGGVLVYNGDEPLLNARNIRSSLTFRTVRFGMGSTNDYSAVSISTDGEGSLFTIGTNHYRIPLIGKHNVINALAAISVAEMLGVKQADIIKGLSNLTITGMRMQVIESPRGFTIINDAWNASPVSMKAAIETLEELDGHSKKIVVLGDMLELGDKAREFHQDIGRIINPEKVDYLYSVGDLGREIASEAEKHFPEGRVKAFRNKDEVIDMIRNIISPSDVVLVKGSRGMELEKIVYGLLKE